MAALPRERSKGTRFRVKRRRRAPRLFGWTIAFGLLGGAGWAAWHFGRPLLTSGEPADATVKVAAEAAPVAMVPVETLATPAPQSVAGPTPPAPVANPLADQSDFRPRPPRDVFEAQVALTRDACCPGSIDGAFGGQTRSAILAFQQKHGIRTTGQLDNPTREALTLREPPLTTYTLSPDDFLRLRPAARGWLEKAALDRLDFSSILELVAEKHWTHPNQIKRLNSSIDWEHLTSGMQIVVPSVSRAAPATRAERVVIHLAERTLEVFDADSRLIAHFPCSIARRVDKRPVGELTIADVAKDPNYTFRPETFPDSAEAQSIGRALTLQPGPNNPVGVAWISLSLSGYGIHGSPEPEKIGRTESAGCFRLSNWNARYLLSIVHVGMPIQVEP